MASPQAAIQGVPSDVEEVPVQQNATVEGVPSDVEEGGASSTPTAAQRTKAAHPTITDPATASAVQRTETSGTGPTDLTVSAHAGIRPIPI